MLTRSRVTAALFLLAVSSAPAPLLAQRPAAPEILLRLDDVGMNHSVNSAIARVAGAGIPFSASVMFACPWYQEAVEILRKHPQVAVGVHLTLNSERSTPPMVPPPGNAGEGPSRHHLG